MTPGRWTVHTHMNEYETPTTLRVIIDIPRNDLIDFSSVEYTEEKMKLLMDVLGKFIEEELQEKIDQHFAKGNQHGQT